MVFGGAFKEFRHELFARMDSVARELELVKVELEKLGRRVVELQTTMSKNNVIQLSTYKLRKKYL